MATLQQKIIDEFLAKMAKSKDIDSAKIEALRTLLVGNKKPKVEDFVRIFSIPANYDWMVA